MKKDEKLKLFLVLLPFCNDIDLEQNRSNELKIKFNRKRFYINNILYKERNVPEFIMDSYKEELEVLPEYILKYYVYHGVKMYVTNRKLRFLIRNEIGYDLGPAEIGGVFINLPDKLKGYVSSNYYSYHYVLLHELGHGIDIVEKFYGIGFEPSATNEFRQIYFEESQRVFNKQGMVYANSPKEYWAQCFALYNLDQETLKNKAPKTFAYMALILLNIKMRIETYRIAM